MTYWRVSNDTPQALAHVATIMLTMISLVAHGIEKAPLTEKLRGDLSSLSSSSTDQLA